MIDKLDVKEGDISQPEFKDHIRDARFWVILVFASQYVLFQIVWPVAYQDAARNLHWGIYLMEEPRFLLDAEDVYDRVYGFPPEEPAMAPAGLARDQGTWFHSWWGPLYPLLIAGLWTLSARYTPLELFTPLCAGFVVVLTYLFGASYFNRRIGFTAALLMGIIPVYREHAVLAYTEPLGALLLLAAFWSSLRRNTLLTVVFGSLSVLLKLDLIFIYLGTMTLSEYMLWRENKQMYSSRHVVFSIGIPGMIAGGWMLLHYGLNNRPMTVLGAPGIEHLTDLAPALIDQLFTTNPVITYFTLGVMILCIWLAFSRRDSVNDTVYRMMGIWGGLGIVVLLVYMFFPGATNSPRILIPTFPAFFLLISAGINQFSVRPRMLVETYLVVILVMMSAVGGLYQAILSEEHQMIMPVWETLRDEPRGFVMTDHFWEVNLYARQPSTWFLGDTVYEHNILHDPDNFQIYLDNHPIRYVVLPKKDDPSIGYKSQRIQIYEALGIGRKLNLRSSSIAGAEVRRYLDNEFAQFQAGDYVIFKLW